MKLSKFILAALIAGGFSPSQAKDIRKVNSNSSPRIVNIVNFIRNVEPRGVTDEVLYETVVQQVKQLSAHGLEGTFLLQYDALINPKYQALLKNELNSTSEIGAWWEITQPHVEAAGIEWRGRFPWDWHANVGFATGYTPEERIILVDIYMEKFKSIFGAYPKSVGSWFIDAHTLGYMYDKYNIIASCNCKDQIGTDGYTLWGGYWNQAYYPSRVNAYMPAQTEKGQISVPIFRMLGSDPIYQYDSGLGGNLQSVITLEPVYHDAGGSKEWVDWFLKSIVDEPCLAFSYTQAGQENSFTWDGMKAGLNMQMPIIEKLFKENKIRVETLAESGAWFKKNYKVTPPTAMTALTDYRERDRKTVWYNSRFYRANLLWEKSSFLIRDIHLFDEKLESDYYKKAGQTDQCVYTTLPFVDGCLWSETRDDLAGLRLMSKDAAGEIIEMQGGTPIVKELKNGMLSVVWPFKDNMGALNILFSEKTMSVTCDRLKQGNDWWLELTVSDKAKEQARLPFASIGGQKIKASTKDFDYAINLSDGTVAQGDPLKNEFIFKILPSKNKISIDLGN